MELEPPGGDPTSAEPALSAVTSPGGHARITLRGEIDLSMTAAFRSTLRDVLVDGFIDVDVNLAEVTFLDSSVLGALVTAHRQVRLFRGALRLESPSAPVVRLLALTALDRVFEVSHPEQQ